MFVLLFKNGDDDPAINFFDEYCMSLVDINNFNELIDNKSFFDQPGKRKQETYEKLAAMSKNDDYMTRKCRILMNQTILNL